MSSADGLFETVGLLFEVDGSGRVQPVLITDRVNKPANARRTVVALRINNSSCRSLYLLDVGSSLKPITEDVARVEIFIGDIVEVDLAFFN